MKRRIAPSGTTRGPCRPFKAVADEHVIPVAQVWDDLMGTGGEVINLVKAGQVGQDGIHPAADGAEHMADFSAAMTP